MSIDSIHALSNGLVLALNELREMLDRHRTRVDEFAGDITLWGFLLGAWECGNAVYHLVANSDFGHASFPCARAAFEAAQDALLLVTEPDYNRAGARARVFERLELANIRDETRYAFGDTEMGRRALGYHAAEEAIRRDAEKWNTKCPGKGDLLIEALEYFRPKFEQAKRGKIKHPAHWSELSRRRIAQEIGKRIKEPDLARKMTAVYAALSRSSHPRLRMEYWARSERPDGSPVLERPERVSKLAIAFADFSVKMAIRAFSIKQPFAVIAK